MLAINSKFQLFQLKWIPKLSPMWGRVLLSRTTSLARLAPFEVERFPNSPFILKSLHSVNHLHFFGTAGTIGKSVITDPDFVWIITPGENVSSVRIVESGNIVLDRGTHLDIDFKPTKGLLQRHTIIRTEERIITCWPHGWGSYFDFVLLVLAKLVRIESALGPKLLQCTPVVYSKFDQPFETDFLGLLGLDPAAIIDSKTLKGAITAQQVVAANNHTTHFPSPRDIRMVRDRFRLHRSGPMRRIYVSRAKTRRVLNESELIPVLREFNIEFVPDVPRTVLEQIELFNGASVIIGPHGAAFTNILWASRGATVIELFNGRYHPPYYYYLANVLEQQYTCWIDPNTSGSGQQMSAQYDNFEVSPSDLRRCLVHCGLSPHG